MERHQPHLVRRLALFVAIVGCLASAYAMFNVFGSAVSAQSEKQCKCPVQPGEKILIQCNSVDPNACGACSVVLADGERAGRACAETQ